MIEIRNTSGDLIYVLNDKDLHFAYLANLDLHDADFRGAELTWACFNGSNLDGADFRGADIRAAHFDEGAINMIIVDETTQLPLPRHLIDEEPHKHPCWM